MARCRFAATAIILVFFASAVVLAAAARNSIPENSPSSTPRALLDLPPSISLFQSNAYKLVRTVFAKGHQHYRFNGTVWEQFNATAKLYDVQTKRGVGVHFFKKMKDESGGQPTWESAGRNGVPFSSVTCVAVESVVVEKENIAWVLLKTTQAHGSKKYFGDVVFVQRYETRKGLAPNSREAPLGAVKKSRYTSLYSFYVSR